MTYELNSNNTVPFSDFQAWTDQWGLIQDNDQGVTTGNGILYTCHYLVGLVEKGLLTNDELTRVRRVLISCAVEPGLFKRAPAGKDGDYEAHDDLIGILGAEAKLFPDRSQRVLSRLILEYGREVRANEIDTLEQDPKKVNLNEWVLAIMKIFWIPRKYVWNSKAPGKFHVSAWLGRRTEVISTMKLATGRFVDPIMWSYWAYSMLTLKPGDSHDSFILRWHMANAAEGAGFLTNWVCRKTKAKIFDSFKDMSYLLSGYFNKPQHPLVALLKDIK